MENEAVKHESENYISKIKNLEKLLSRLNRIGVMLSAEKNTDKLLDMILKESMEITRCDAGSIYVKVEKDGISSLMFRNTRNISREFPFKEFFLPIDCNSIAGYCAYLGKPFNFKSMKDVTGLLGLNHNDYFDKQINYRTVNMLVIPMMDIKGEIVGVLQLINKKREFNKGLIEPEDFDENIIPFSEDEENIILSLASQTAVLLERTGLMEEIENLFDSFVESMVTTIERRDPTTSGHSVRVARFIKHFAEAINNVNYGKYKDLVFSEEEIKELNYAALLHDIGKIGVSESVLLKENRLTNSEISSIQYRFNYFKKDLEVKKLLGIIKKVEEAVLNEIDEYCEFITNVNTKGFLGDEELDKIRLIGSIKFTDLNDKESPLLTDEELIGLTVKKGNLTYDDREKMNLHAAYTYQILKDIPWVENLKCIPIIASAHHEKLDGTGYPNHLKSDEISVQSKMLSIVDIFEALTAMDRPYKKAMPADKALKILEEEGRYNHIDNDLLEIFCREKIHEKCLKA